MKLTSVFGIDATVASIILVGKPEITSILDSEEKPYWLCHLKEPIMVGCSIDKEVEKFETTEVYVRQDALEEEGWEFVDKDKPELGFYRPNWKVDFSKGQEIPIYQSTTIAKWTKENRIGRSMERRTGINARIKERMEARKNQ